jgi:peptidyl-prolyl cis-trans isomerase D
MITSLQNFFLKHNKWLFGGLLIVIIVTFVLTIGPQSFFGSGASSQRKALNYYGYDLTSESDQRAMAFTAELSGILHPELRLRREQLMDYAYLRIAGLGIANQMGIPQPSKVELADYVETLMIFMDPATGEFSAESYNRMMEALQTSARFDKESIGVVLREDYRIDQVRQALGGPDYSLPFETRQDFIDRQTSYSVALARFDYASFNPEIVPEDEALLQFFNENPARYEIPEAISVSALLFKSGAYIGEAGEPTESELEIFFASNAARYQPEPDMITGEVVNVTLAEVSEQVVADWKEQQARRIAAKKSEQFSLKLYEAGIALDSPEFNALIESFKVETMDVPAYSRTASPNLPDVPAEVLDSMWIYANNPNRYFSDIAQIANGAVVLVSRGLTEARMPAFEEVRAQVLADYAVTEKRRLFAEKGNELYTTLSERLANESLADIAASLDLTVEEVDTFTGSNVPQSLLASTVWDQAMHLEAGRLTRMVINGDQGIFGYIASREAPEIDESSEEYLAYVNQRSNALGEAMGWARLREITDNSISRLMGSSAVAPE